MYAEEPTFEEIGIVQIVQDDTDVTNGNSPDGTNPGAELHHFVEDIHESGGGTENSHPSLDDSMPRLDDLQLRDLNDDEGALGVMPINFEENIHQQASAPEHVNSAQTNGSLPGLIGPKDFATKTASICNNRYLAKDYYEHKAPFKYKYYGAKFRKGAYVWQADLVGPYDTKEAAVTPGGASKEATYASKFGNRLRFLGLANPSQRNTYMRLNKYVLDFGPVDLLTLS